MGSSPNIQTWMEQRGSRFVHITRYLETLRAAGTRHQAPPPMPSSVLQAAKR